MHKPIFFIFTLILLFSCSSNSKTEKIREDSGTLAKVGSKRLFIADLPKFLFSNIDKKDSLDVLDNFTENWIKEEIYSQKAIEIISNLSYIETKAENYKRELIIDSYDKELLKNIEVDLSEKELLEYYEKHKEYFIFDEIFFELKYVIIPKNTSNLAKLKKSISKGEETHWLIDYCKKEPSKCFLKKSTIKNTEFLTKKLKLSTIKQNISNNYKFQYIDSDNVMIYKIVKVYKNGDIAPFEIVKSKVTSLALHKKKQDYLQDIKEKTYQKAKDDEIFEKFIN